MLQNLLACATATLAATFAVPCLAADGIPDPGFGTAGISYVATDDVSARSIYPHATIELPDGKLLFAGARNKVVPPAPFYEPQIRGMLLRLNADGSPDTTFGNTTIDGLHELPDLVTGTRMQGIESIARFPDGSYVAVGTGMVNQPIQGYIVKLTEGGDVDESFGSAGVVLMPMTYLHTVRLDSQQRIVVGGEHFDNVAFVYTTTIARLDGTGAYDATFGTDGVKTIAWSDPASSGYVDDLAVVDGDAIVIGGGFEANGPGLGNDYALARLKDDGSFDPTFASVGWRVFHDPSETSVTSRIERIAPRADGSIAFAGYHNTSDNITGLVFGSVNPDGSTDTTFGQAANPGYFKPAILPSAESANATGLIIQPDGKLVASAAYYTSAKENFVAVRCNANGGDLDATFANAGVFEADLAPTGIYSEIDTLALQRDGRIVAAGRAQRTTGSALVDFATMRLLNPSADLIFANGFD
ncbi:hypothetical protein [Dokdonella sp.]|uniref:hypothetical protein n=1 Tax=Dokdonella sp. TaxID=2291710 RepID=UPI003783462A